MPNVVTADAQGNLQCAAPIESVLQQSSVAVVTAVDVTYTASSGNLAVSVQDITGAVKQDSVNLPTSTQNISTWANGTTQAIVLGSDGKLYLANPTGAPSTHNPVSKTNDVDWFGAFTTLNDLLQYALSGSSFLASDSSAPKYTKQASVPTDPNAGDVWRTTSATVAPYAKDATYQWDGAAWVLAGGRPESVATSTGVRDAAMGVGTQFDNIDLTVVTNDLNATVTPDGITVARAGTYFLEANLNPGSLYTTHATTAGGVAFYTVSLHVNGNRIAETTQMVFVNDSAGTVQPVTLGTSCNTFLNAELNAGDLVEMQLYISGLALTYNATLKVAAVS